MGGAIGGGFASSGGSFHENLKMLARLHQVNLAAGENFGLPGKGRKVRVIEANDPEAAAREFFDRMKVGGEPQPLGGSNTTNDRIRVTFKDGSTVVLRLKSKSGGPAISLNDKQGTNFKIHFEPKSTERK
jgi:hypothetical protein